MGRHLTNLVQQDRTTVRKLEAPFALGERPGKSAFLVPEKFALDKILGNSRAVHFDERTIGAGTLAIDGPRHQLLAGTALSLDQHCRLGPCHLADEISESLHGRAAPQEFATGRLRRIALAQVPIDLNELSELLSLLEGDINLV